MAFSADENQLFVSTATSEHTVIHSLPVATNADLKTGLPLGRKVCHSIAPHPGGRWLAIELGTQLGVLDWKFPEALRVFNIGGAYDFGPIIQKQFDSPEVQRKLGEWKNQLPPEQWEDLQQLYEAEKQVAHQATPVPVERLASLQSTPDGRWLICGTDAGVRVFAWSKFFDPNTSSPIWDYSVEAEAPCSDDRRDAYNTREIYSIAFDTARQRILFGGAEGKLKYLDLETSRSGDLLSGPERIPITRMSLSPDGRVVAMTRCDAHRGNDSKSSFQIWDYSALCRMVV